MLSIGSPWWHLCPWASLTTPRFRVCRWAQAAVALASVEILSSLQIAIPA
jgi:hypothetical protein